MLSHYPGYYPGATYAKFNAADQLKVYKNKNKYGLEHGRNRTDNPRDGGDRTMSDLYNVHLMNLEDELRKIAKVNRSTRKRIRAAEKDTSRKNILASSNDDDILKFSKTDNDDNRALGSQPQQGSEQS